MADGVLIRFSVPSTRQPILRTLASNARQSLNEISLSLALDGIRIVLEVLVGDFPRIDHASGGQKHLGRSLSAISTAL